MYGSSLSLKKLSAILAGCMAVVGLLILTLSMSAPRTVAEDAEVFVETVPVPVIADLSVTRSGPASVMRGTNLTSMFTVHNNGPASAEGVALNVLLSGDMTYVSASAGGCSFNADIGQVVCTLGTMSSGENRTVSLTFSVNTTANCQTGEADNSASVSADSEDGDIANNLIQDVITIECPSQSAQQSSSSSSAMFVPPPPPLQASEDDDFDVYSYDSQEDEYGGTPEGQPDAEAEGNETMNGVTQPQQQPILPAAALPASYASSSAASSVPAVFNATTGNTVTDGQVVFSAPGMTCRMVQSMLRCDMGTPDFSQGGTSMQRSFQSPSATSNGQPFNPFSGQ